MEAFRGFFQQNSSSDTKIVTIQLIELCTAGKQKSRRELYRLYLEFKKSATQAKHHVSELQSFVTKSAVSVGQSLSGFSQDGLRATMVASGLLWALTNGLISVKALQFAKVVEDVYENTTGCIVACALGLSPFEHSIFLKLSRCLLSADGNLSPCQSTTSKYCCISCRCFCDSPCTT